MPIKLSAKHILTLLGSAIVALIVAFVLAAISVSGVQSMATANLFLWVAVAVFILTILASAMTYCPEQSGSKSAVATILFIIMIVAGFWGREKLSQWLFARKAEQLASEKLPEPPANLKIRAPFTRSTPDKGNRQSKRVHEETGVYIRQTGTGSAANPGVLKGQITTTGPCTVIQNGGSNNTASPICNPDPNAIIRRYFCDGTALNKNPKGAILGSFSQDRGVLDDFSLMSHLNDSAKFAELLKTCTTESSEHPEWATPLLFCSEANRQLGNFKEAIMNMRDYDKKKSDLDEQPARCFQYEKNIKKALGIF